MDNYDDDNEELVWISDSAEQQEWLLQLQQEHEVFPPEIVPSHIAAAHASANTVCVSRPFMTTNSSNHSRSPLSPTFSSSSSSSSSSTTSTCCSSSPLSSPLPPNSTTTTATIPPPCYDSSFQSSISSAFLPPHHPSLHKRNGRMISCTKISRCTSKLYQICLSSILNVLDMILLGMPKLYCIATKAFLFQNHYQQHQSTHVTMESLPPFGRRVTCLLLQTKAWVLVQLQEYNSLYYDAPSSYYQIKNPYHITHNHKDDDDDDDNNVCHEHDIC